MTELPSWIATHSADESDRFEPLRAAARRSLSERGLPSKKTEQYRFTSVRDLIETPFDLANGDADTSSVLRRLGQDETYRVIVGNGAPMLTGSTRDGVRIFSLDEALEAHGEALERVLGRSVPNEHFAAANTASFDDAVVVVVPAGVRAEVPVHLVHAVSACSKDAVASPRVVVLAGEDSSLSLVETYLGDTAGRAFINAVVEFDLARGASVDHLVAGSSLGRTIAAIGVSIGDDATYRCRSALVGGQLTRFDHHVALEGARASVDLAGVLVAHGNDHVDHHVVVDHRGPKGTSRQKFRGLADGHGTVVFDGIAKVRATAPGCDIGQEIKNLLLSPDATIHAKPHLEIDVDEVVASHGTTVGSFDRDQLFYLRARGLDETMARSLLTSAFVRAALDDVAIPSVKKRLLTSVLASIAEGAATSDDEEPS